MTLRHFTRFLGLVGLVEPKDIIHELEEHITKRIEAHMAGILQPILDAVTAGFGAINTSLTNEFAEIQTKLDELLAKIAAGGNVTAADVQAVVDQVATASTGVTKAIDDETAKIAAVEPPA